MGTVIHQRVEEARAGQNPTVICKMPSGWLVLADTQFLRGYCILLPDPVVGSLNDLNREQRAAYLCDMAQAGDALLEATGAYRINYAIMGNSDPALHAHIVPRYLNEPAAQRNNQPWSYPAEVMAARKFDAERDRELMERIREVLRAG